MSPGPADAADTADEPAEAGALITAETLFRRLGEPGLVVVDATLFLPAEGRAAYAEHIAARIPGSQFFDIDLFADPETDLPHMVPSAGRFARLAAGLGVTADSLVVAYDRRGLFSAGRAWWLFRLFGHARVVVLDGGLPAWVAAGLPVQTGAPGPVAALRAGGAFIATLHVARWRGLGDVLDNIDQPREILLDARAAPRFAGSAAEPRPGVRAGHVPGARSLPFASLLTATGQLLPPDALRTRFAAVGVDGSRPVVTMCGSGVTATVLNLAMVVAGLPEGAVYDGSWTEWGGRTDTPVSASSDHNPPAE